MVDRARGCKEDEETEESSKVRGGEPCWASTGLLALMAPFPETHWVLVEDSRRYPRHLSVISTPLPQYLPFLVVASCIFLIFGSLLLHAGLSLVAASGGYSAVAVRRLLAVVASFVAEHGF